MGTREHRSISIMPTVDGRRMPDMHHIDQVPAELSDEAVGQVVGDCLRILAGHGITPDENIVTLEMKFA